METIKHALSKFATFIDPFLVIGIFILFLIPVITILNLTPRTYTIPENENVLGTTDATAIRILTNTTPAEGISIDKVSQTSDTSYTLYISHEPHRQGTYDNTIFTAVNNTDSEKRIHVTSTFEGVSPGTIVSIRIEDVRYIVLDSDGTLYPPTITITPDSSVEAGIEINSPDQVNFKTGFSVDLTIE